MARKRPKRTARGGAGTHVVWPVGVELRYGITKATRWRWEREKKLPPRDFYLDGEAVGWRPATLDAADAGELAKR
jgi:predicted DNA-binding transcriptional regulator AlpA